MSFVVKSKIQEFAKKNDLMVGSDFYSAMDEEIGKLLNAAMRRCKDNKRKTLRAYDL